MRIEETMQEDDFFMVKECLESIAHQLKRIADRIEARDKAEDKRREEAEILSERIAEADARRKHETRYAP